MHMVLLKTERTKITHLYLRLIFMAGNSLDFAHLHVHSEYSLLDGFSRIKKLVQQAKVLGMSHLAITDHGAMYGAIEFYKECQTKGVNPVIGIEAYLTENMRDHSKRF